MNPVTAKDDFNVKVMLRLRIRLFTRLNAFLCLLPILTITQQFQFRTGPSDHRASNVPHGDSPNSEPENLTGVSHSCQEEKGKGDDKRLETDTGTAKPITSWLPGSRQNTGTAWSLREYHLPSQKALQGIQYSFPNSSKKLHSSSCRTGTWLVVQERIPLVPNSGYKKVRSDQDQKCNHHPWMAEGSALQWGHIKWAQHLFCVK